MAGRAGGEERVARPRGLEALRVLVGGGGGAGCWHPGGGGGSSGSARWPAPAICSKNPLATKSFRYLPLVVVWGVLAGQGDSPAGGGEPGWRTIICWDGKGGGVLLWHPPPQCGRGLLCMRATGCRAHLLPGWWVTACRRPRGPLPLHP